MKTRTDWKDYKKKHKIPDGLVEKIEFGPALGKCADVVNNDAKSTSDKLTAVVKFHKQLLIYKPALIKLNTPISKLVLKFVMEVETEIAEIFDNTNGQSDGKGVLVNLCPDKGDIIDKATASIEKHRKLGDDKGLRRLGEENKSTDKDGHSNAKLESTADFSKAGSEPIVLLAHGSTLDEKSTANTVATDFAEKTPAEIVAFLSKSLPLTYHGVVYLDGCFTAAGNSPLNYAQQIYKLLVKKGYMYLQVKGNLGLAVTINGKEFVYPAALEDYKKSLADKLNELKRQDESLEQIRKKRIQLEGLIKSNNQTKQMVMMIGMKTRNKASEESLKAYDNTTYQKGIEELDKQLNDPQVATRQKLIKQLEDIISKNYTIEALTGTFGPERLPPKSK